MGALANDVPGEHDMSAGTAGVVEQVEAFRAALVDCDLERMQSLRWLAPRPPT